MISDRLEAGKDRREKTSYLTNKLTLVRNTAAILGTVLPSYTHCCDHTLLDPFSDSAGHRTHDPSASSHNGENEMAPAPDQQHRVVEGLAFASNRADRGPWGGWRGHESRGRETVFFESRCNAGSILQCTPANILLSTVLVSDAR